MKTSRIVAGPLTLVLALGACAGDDTPVTPATPEAAALLSVAPAGGATGVDRFGPVVVEFDHPLMSGMEDRAVLHQGDVRGPEVAGAWLLDGDRTTLTFTPASPLAALTTYTVHLGGGMMDAEGNHVDLESHGSHMGGVWATSGMMGGGMMGGGMMGGAMGEAHMGPGWQHPSNGSYGMVFGFTTGS